MEPAFVKLNNHRLPLIEKYPFGQSHTLAHYRRVIETQKRVVPPGAHILAPPTCCAPGGGRALEISKVELVERAWLILTCWLAPHAAHVSRAGSKYIPCATHCAVGSTPKLTPLPLTHGVLRGALRVPQATVCVRGCVGCSPAQDRTTDTCSEGSAQQGAERGRARGM